jgi:uncharacterized protein YyaL (SSP411 family)
MPNRLIHEQSPYLLQHAHNPVDWYPWGDEPFRKAAEEGKPLIVSIGYAACHWCHEMEHESFEDPETAAYMNAHFVCIKVDREEHPDVDQLYMDAVQAISGSGGWPLNVFVTPGRVPFYGGTYYPPRPAYNRPSWMQIMQRMDEIWTTQRSEVDAQSAQMIQYLRQAAKAAGGEPSAISREDCAKLAESLLKMADRDWGGFGAAPKFPGTMAITFLLERYQYTGSEEALQHALLSLDKMIAGGIYDQLGGGFARYSTDREWLAPHFEKMLYDNALILSTLCDAYKISRKSRYETVIRETFAFVNRELRDDAGAFYSALDADSEGEEGKFYTWTWDEWQADTLGGHAVGEAYFGIRKEGNWEKTNILHEARPLPEVAAAFGMSVEECRAQIEALKARLYEARSTRVPPLLDDKRLLSWNALMNSALTKAALVLEGPEYLRQAAAHMQWMYGAFRTAEGALMHTWKAGAARIPAKLDDYAYLMLAMIQLGGAGGDHSWLLKASELCEEAIGLFSDAESPFFYYSSSLQTDIPVRKADVYDGATPSGNAVMAQVLQLLGMLTERSEWTARAGELLARMNTTALRYTYSFGHWATLLQRTLAEPKTVVVSGKFSGEVHAAISRSAPPHAIVINITNASEELTLAEGRKSDKESLIFVCTGTACLPPVTTPADALQLL